ncbi:hypothetical protein QE422_001234 [Chryseobacterium sp. SORGH_AS 447]|nr:hypothetical protein [Chryseobacterium sp. SORGH_AS_0447]
MEVKSADCTNGTPAPIEIAQSLNLFDLSVNGATFAEPEEKVFGYCPDEATAVESCAKATVGTVKANATIAKLNFIVYFLFS